MGPGGSSGRAWAAAALGRALLPLLVPLLLPPLLHGSAAEAGRYEPRRYEPTWESLDARELPAWYDEAKFGIFIHWGVYTVPGFGSEWFWWYWRQLKLPEFVHFMKANYPPGFTYEEFAVEFKGTFFNASTWADILESSGAKYVVLTTKHHEGFNLWKSNNSWNWNSVDRGPRKDIVKEMEIAIRNKTKMHFGLYYSLFEWFNPLFLEDQANSFQTRYYPPSKSLPDLYDLVNTYKPEILWSDGDGDAPDTYWNSTGFLAWLYNDSPVRDIVVTNDRWGLNNICKHGGFFTCTDRYNPGHLLPHKWENCLTIDKESWSYRRDAELSDYLTIEEIVEQLMETVSCGGNFLMNISPTKDGVIPPIFEERLRQIGSWLQVNGESIYGTKPWRAQNDTVTPRVWYTSKPKENLVYAMLLQWPLSRLVVLGQPTATLGATEVKLLGYEHPLKWTSLPNHGIVVELPELTLDEMPCKWGWSLEMKNVN